MLADPRGVTYRPDPLGLSEARRAIAGERGDPDRIVLTANTSEAYSLLFKLLCDPGASVLVPQPSYPLFDILTGLDSLVPRPYLLDSDAGWQIDFGAARMVDEYLALYQRLIGAR